MTDITYNLKGFTARKPKRVLKRAYLVSGKVIIVIDDEVLKKMQIDIENTWFEEENVDNAIFLKPTKPSQSK